MSEVLLRGATLVTCDLARQVDLLISGHDAIGRGAGVPSFEVDLSGHLIFPGLVNAHDHLHLNCIPPMPQSSPYPNSYDWARDFQQYRRTAPVARALTAELELRFFHGALKNLLAGTTAVAHHDPIPAAVDEARFPLTLLRDFGWSHSLGLGMPDIVPTGLPGYGPSLVESYRSTPKDRPWMIHLAEGTDRLAESELSMLDALGCLADNTVLIHGVGITEAQVERVISAGASIVWCPSSNLRLLGRTLNPRRLFAARRLALGTDSRLSGTRDLLEEMRIAALHSDLTARELLSLVTSTAAAILRMGDVGKVELRGHIDLIALRNNGDDPYEQLLASNRADLRAVVRGGLPVIADPDFADWFAAAAIKTQSIDLDGRPKLLSATQISAAMLEPGLTLVQPDVRS